MTAALLLLAAIGAVTLAVVRHIWSDADLLDAVDHDPETIARRTLAAPYRQDGHR